MYWWVIMENSTGNLYYLSTKTDDTEEVYRVFGKQVYGMPDDLDTGNVDIDIFLLDHTTKENVVTPIEFD